jgi:hypothetical protein
MLTIIRGSSPNYCTFYPSMHKSLLKNFRLLLPVSPYPPPPQQVVEEIWGGGGCSGVQASVGSHTANIFPALLRVYQGSRSQQWMRTLLKIAVVHWWSVQDKHSVPGSDSRPAGTSVETVTCLPLTVFLTLALSKQFYLGMYKHRL